MSTEKKHQCVNHYITDLCEWLHKAFKEVQAQSTSEAEWQRWYYDCKANAISLEPGDLVLAKADAYKGRRKVKDQLEEETIWSAMQDCQRHPFLPHEKSADQMLMSPPSELTSSHHSHNGSSFMFRCTCWAVKVHTILKEPSWKVSENEEVPQSAKCLPAQCQTGETPLGWVNRKFCTFLSTFPRASLLNKG